MDNKKYFNELESYQVNEFVYFLKERKIILKYESNYIDDLECELKNEYEQIKEKLSSAKKIVPIQKIRKKGFVNSYKLWNDESKYEIIHSTKTKYEGMTQEESKSLITKKSNLENILSYLKIIRKNVEVDEFINPTGTIHKKNEKELATQPIEIMRVLKEKGWNVESEFSNEMCLYIGNHIATKCKTDQTKIASIRKQIERIKDKNKLK